MSLFLSFRNFPFPYIDCKHLSTMGRPTYFLDLHAVVFASFCHYKLIEDCYHGLKKDLHRTLISALLLQSVTGVTSARSRRPQSTDLISITLLLRIFGK